MSTTLQEDLQIDEQSLEIEILRQPELLSKYLTIEATCKNEHEIACDNLDKVEVMLDQKIRKDPAKYECEKITEPIVTAAIRRNKKYEKAKRAVLITKHELNSAKSAVRVIENKKSSLEHMVKLHALSYFAGPSVPHSFAEMEKLKQQKISSNIKINKKSKKNDKKEKE